MIKKITFLLLTAMLISCSNPLDKKYSEATLEQDAKELKESKKVSEEDYQLMAGWILKAKLTGESLEGKTYNEIITSAKNYQLEQENLKKEAELAEAEKAKKMTDAVTVTITGKEFYSADWDSSNVFKFAIKNKSSKTIDAIKFNFEVYNKLGDKIGDGYEMSLTSDKIAPNEVYTNGAYYDYNEFIDDNVVIKNSNYEDLKFVVKVEKIVYTDQSVLE